MTIATLITTLRNITQRNVTQLGDAQALVYLNFAYLELAEKLMELDENYFFAETSIDAVSGQTNGQYTFTVPSSTAASIRRIKFVDILVDSENTYFTRAREIDPASLSETWDLVLVNQSLSDPVYYLVDDGIRIAPNFTANTIGVTDNNQIKIGHINTIIELLSGGAETTIQIPREYHQVICKKAAPWIFRQMDHYDKAESAEIVAARAEQEMFSRLGNRVDDTMISQIPDTTSLEA